VNVPPEPTIKRAVAFIDGQNLFYAAKKAFGYQYPNYDPKLLAAHITSLRRWGQAFESDSAEKPPFAKILGDQKSLIQHRKSIVGHL